LIMPIFALANAGVPLQIADINNSIAMAVMLGLVIGKPVGIVLVSWLATRLGWATLPEGINWKILTGAGCLAGIGFTMALFIAGLALADEALNYSKVGILVGSAVSAALGMGLLLATLPRSAKAK
jgi:Na+:H+ antiporter, NhaA family